MNATIVIGMTGEGKSEFVKKMIKYQRAYVFDVNNEYKWMPDDKGRDHFQMRHIDCDVKVFRERCFKLTNTNCVFEEATGFFAGKVESEMRRLIQKKRHSGNNFIFLFHSIQDTPPFMFRLCNYVVLFKTGDVLRDVEDKAPRLVDAFLELQKCPSRPERSPIVNKRIIKLAA